MFGPADHMIQLTDDEVIDPSRALPGACLSLINDARRAKVSGQGLLPRAVQFLFKVVRAKGAAECTARATFMEIYNEKIFDLLNPSGGEFQVRQKAGEQGFHVPGLTTVECAAPEALLEVLRRGVAVRHTAGHALSRESSRAHAIFS